jgi:hypothetical protein
LLCEYLFGSSLTGDKMQQNLKINKTTKNMQKRYLLLVLIVFSILTFFIQNVNASQYYQYVYPQNDSHTTTIYGWINYPYEDRIVREQITDGYFYQFAIMYSMYPKLWNDQSPNLIQYCQINITTQQYYSTLNGDSPTQIIQEYYQRVSDTDLNNQEFYISLSRGDTAYFKLDCYFTNSSMQSLNIPANLQVRTPTYECQQCKKYEWSKIQPTLYKADTLLQANTNNIEYIKKIIFINFEFLVIAYWFILILAVIFAVGLIFLAVYWVYIWLSKVTR